MTTPTPEDFERARADAARYCAVSEFDSCLHPNQRNIARCYTEALSRLEAAERKVAVAERFLKYQASLLDLASALGVADPKPEVKP